MYPVSSITSWSRIRGTEAEAEAQAEAEAEDTISEATEIASSAQWIANWTTIQ